MAMVIGMAMVTRIAIMMTVLSASREPLYYLIESPPATFPI